MDNSPTALAQWSSTLLLLEKSLRPIWFSIHSTDNKNESQDDSVFYVNEITLSQQIMYLFYIMLIFIDIIIHLLQDIRMQRGIWIFGRYVATDDL